MKLSQIFIKLTAAALSLCMLTGFAAVTVSAEETDEAAVVYNGNELEPFASRTKQEIGERYSAARSAGESYRNGNSSTYYEEKPSLTDPYAAGRLTEDTHTAMIAEANYLRWLVGASLLTEASQHSDDLQAGALVRNWEFDHSISDDSKPEDMSDELWQLGAQASHNILARGYTPRGAIDGWMDEGYSLRTEKWDTIGHRMAIIGYSVSSLQLGYAGSIAIGLEAAFENTAGEQPFFTYPAPGNMPYNSIPYKTSAWSVQLNTQKIRCTDSSAVTVTVTNLATNEAYECTTANNKLSGYSTLVFVQPVGDENGYYYQDASSYKVEISGLQDVETGKEARIEYTVNFFDVTAYSSTYAKSVKTADGYSNIVIGDRNASTENLEKLAAVLPQQVAVTGENGRVYLADTAGKWVLDEDNTCWRNSVNPQDLPDGLSDPDGVLNDITITYETDSSYNYSRLSAYPSTLNEGDSGELRIWRYMVSTNVSEIYQLKESVNGYTAAKRFDSRIDPYTTEDAYHIYTVDSYKASDSGEYIGLYYDDSVYDNDAYATNTVTISVEKAPVDLLGFDVNGDGAFNGGDVTATLKYIVKFNQTSFFAERADINEDGTISVKDATMMQKYVVGLLS